MISIPQPDSRKGVARQDRTLSLTSDNHQSLAPERTRLGSCDHRAIPESSQRSFQKKSLPSGHVVRIGDVLSHRIGGKIVATIIAKDIGDIGRITGDSSHGSGSESEESERS